MNQQPAVVELLPEEEEHAKSQSKGLGSLVKLHAYRILTARCAEERRRMDSGQLHVLLANDKRCGRVEKVGKGPYEPWRVRLHEVVMEGSSGDAQAVLIEAPPFLLTKWIDVGDFALKRGHNKRGEGVPVRQHVPNDSSEDEFIVEVLEQTTDDAGRDILTVVRVDEASLSIDRMYDERTKMLDDIKADRPFGRDLEDLSREDENKGGFAENKGGAVRLGAPFKCFPGDLQYYPHTGATVWV